MGAGSAAAAPVTSQAAEEWGQPCHSNLGGIPEASVGVGVHVSYSSRLLLVNMST